MKIKRIIAAALALSVAVSLAACGDSDSSSKKEKNDSSTSAADKQALADAADAEARGEAVTTTTTTAAEESKAEESSDADVPPIVEKVEVAEDKPEFDYYYELAAEYEKSLLPVFAIETAFLKVEDSDVLPSKPIGFKSCLGISSMKRDGL